jgi:hydrogenase small subunit
MATDNLLAELLDRGVTRRDFLKFCGGMAAVLGLSSSYVPTIAHALETKKKPILVWIECQSCTGDTEALLRATKPTVSELILDSPSTTVKPSWQRPASRRRSHSPMC